MPDKIKDVIAIKRYSTAFFSFVRGSIGLAVAVEDMKNFRNILYENPQLKRFLNAFEATQVEKGQLLDKILAEGFSQEFRNFLKLLLEKRRIDKIHGIADYFIRAYSHKEEEDALLRSTFPLDLDLLEKIKERLEKKLNKKFNLYLELDPALLGGIQIVIGNTIIDGSVSKRLKDLKQKLLNARVV